MTAIPIPCTRCRSPLYSDLFTANSTVTCGKCGTAITAYLYPALTHTALVSRPSEAVLTDSEASCFFHPAKKAVVSCEGCGRFLCGLCDLEWESKHLCVSCLESGKKKGKIRNLQNSRVLYDQVALSTAVVPLLLWFISWITAPIALYLVIRYWNAPGSLVSRSRWRFIVAAFFAVGEIVGWVWVLALMFHVANR